LIFVSGGAYASTRVVVDPFAFPLPTEEAGLLRREDGLELGMLIGSLMMLGRLDVLSMLGL
jgi:hypothetical protein